MKDINAIKAKFFKDYPNAIQSKNDFTTGRVALGTHSFNASLYFIQSSGLAVLASLQHLSNSKSLGYSSLSVGF